MQQNIKEKTNTKKRRVIQIAERVNGDNCFKAIDSLQQSLLLALTRDVKNEEVRKWKMEALSKEDRYSHNKIGRRLIDYAFSSGVTPEELFDINS